VEQWAILYKKQVTLREEKKKNFHNDGRKLGEDHVTWRRRVVIDIAHNLGSFDNDTKRSIKTMTTGKII
jgi:hypothetical protein